MEDLTDSTKIRKWSSRKPAIDTLDSSKIKKTAADSKAKGKKSDLHTACVVNSYQRKDA